MYQDCRLPPLYRLVPVPKDGDVMAEAANQARSGADPLTVLCAARDDRFDCAVILHPDIPSDAARLMVYVGALGLGDGIGAVVPAGLDVTYRWPNIIEANLGSAGAVNMAIADIAAADAVPDWLVLRAVAVIGLEGSIVAGEALGPATETALREEGDAETTTAILLESYTRHLLTWINRWQDDGFDPVRAMWLRHAPSVDEEVRIEAGEEHVSGIFRDIGDDGAMVMEIAGEKRSIPFSAAIDAARNAVVGRWTTPEQEP